MNNQVTVNVQDLLMISNIPEELVRILRNNITHNIVTSRVKKEDTVRIYKQRVLGLPNSPKENKLKAQIEAFLLRVSSINAEEIYLTLIKTIPTSYAIFWDKSLKECLGFFDFEVTSGNDFTRYP